MKILQRTILLGFVGLLCCACSSQKYNLSKTIWFNFSPAEKDGQKGSVVTSLYFTSENTVDIYSSVVVDTMVLVKPFMCAKGKYSTLGSSRQGTDLSIEAVTLKKDTVLYRGMYQKDMTMILVSDSVANVFNIMPDVQLP